MSTKERIQCEVEFNRNLIPPGLKRTVEFTLSLENGESSLYLDRLLYDLLPDECFNDEEIVNVRGRDESLVFLPLKKTPCQNELAYIEGTFLFPSHDQDPDAPLTREVPFSIQAETKYKPNEDYDVNCFKTNWEGMPAFVKGWSPRTLGRMFPVNLVGFRIGLLFHSKRGIGHVMGAAPILTDYLLIDNREDELLIIVRNEHAGSKKRDLSLPGDVFESLEKIVQSISGVSLNALYKKER